MGQSGTLALVGGIFAFIILVLVLAFVFSPAARLKRALRAMPLVPIAELPEGAAARIAGAAGPVRDQLVAPFSGTACVYYIAVVERRVKSGKNHHWRTVCTEARGVPFLVDDGGGRVVVDPQSAKVALATDSVSRSGTFDDPTPEETAFLTRNGVNASGLLGFNKSLRYTEKSIAVGEKVSIRGTPTREPESAGGPRFRMTGTREHPLLITDDAKLSKAS